MRNLTAPPTAVSVAQFRRALAITDDDGADELALSERLRAAQAVVETASGRPLGVRTMEFSVRWLGWRRWWFPMAPVVSLTGIQAQADDGSWSSVSLSQVRAESLADEPQIVLRDQVAALSGVRDGAAMRVTVEAGHPETGLPGGLTQAIILIANEWREAGITPMSDSFRVGGAQPPKLSFAVHALIRQARYQRPCEMASC